MEKKEKRIYLVLIIIFIAIILTIFYLKEDPISTDEQTAICIGENSAVYTQPGCSACAKQKELFGENYNHITDIDCQDQTQKCIDENILKTPTWIIDNQKIEGYQSIAKLKELTGC